MLNRTTPPEPKKPRECTKYKRNLKALLAKLHMLSLQKLSKELFSIDRNNDYYCRQITVKFAEKYSALMATYVLPA